MKALPLRALVVDDDPSIRQLTARALRGEGFSCDLANDGIEAQVKLGSDCYDLVVTDLCMPNRHGHALASELLYQSQRPLIVVLTALSDPRMTKDLLARGVDDVVFKPINYLTFAAKLRALVNRRKVDSRPAAAPAVAAAGVERQVEAVSKPMAVKPIPPHDFETQLAKVSLMLPLSQHILDVSQLAQSKACDSQQLAEAVESEAALAAEILRLANSSFYSPVGGRIANLVDAIPRIGHRRVGELALSMHALRILSVGSLPWMDRELAWRRSVAAGLAVDLLVAQGGHKSIQNGLFLSATMHGLGRVTLGLLFPRQYEELVAACQRSSSPLQDFENRVFPVSHCGAMARLLQTWAVPPDVYQPLRYMFDDFAATSRFAEPMRSKVELVKLAVLLGWIAVGSWEPWDAVEFVPETAFKRLSIGDPSAILFQIKDAMISVTGQSASSAAIGAIPDGTATTVSREIRYRKLASETYDALALMFPGMNLAICPATDRNELNEIATKPTLVNCLDATAVQIDAHGAAASREESILLGHGRQLAKYDSRDGIVRLPTSYATFRTACERAIV